MAGVAVVTGAASGIGRATVELFAERGFGVVAVDVAEEGLAELALIESVRALVGDVADDEVNDAAVGLALSEFGRLDVSVLNAGIGGAGPLESEGALGRLEHILAVNVRGVASGIRAALPPFRAAGGGAVVVTSSISGLRGDPGTWAYNASKAAVINLVRGLALDYAVENVRINTVAPGAALTGMTEGLLENPALARSLTRRIPLQRWSSAREQAEVIWFLASPAASFVTGVTVPVDGGLSASGGLLPPPTTPGESGVRVTD
ncbi:SDR family oxidoreductase [Catenulispora yoronensis]|uniref:SDR family oxidoreductase n=1 Tax=Catenulispora yoronensis TaxID=450799 RepID=A0ABP5H3P2_9ACTN